MSGDEVSVVIVQTAAVSFIVLPMFETTLASQSARKSGWRSGCQEDDGSGFKAEERGKGHRGRHRNRTGGRRIKHPGGIAKANRKPADRFIPQK
jgi:hypothetical protein